MKHTCHWPSCDKQVAPKMWGCRKHWFTLPAKLRARIWKHYRPGQEDDKQPSNEYISAARDVRNWCLKYEAARKERSPQ